MWNSIGSLIDSMLSNVTEATLQTRFNLYLLSFEFDILMCENI